MSRVIVITGASKGLGLAMVKHLVALGDQVYGLSRSASPFAHANYHHSEVNVANHQAVSAFFKQLRNKTRCIDVLVNNAGIASMNAFAITPAQTIENIFDINVHGTATCSQKALGLLKKSHCPRIVNMTTVAVPLLLEGEAVYAASKSAVETLTKILAKEYGHFGITCNAIGPSPIDTALIRGVSKDKISRLIKRQAIKKMATESDVLNALDFLIKPESNMITGQVLYLGGVSA